jgi:hypothetical protein
LIVHIGAPKTGSTYLQNRLWANRSALEASGVELPGPRQRFHFAAGNDLLGEARTYTQEVRQGPSAQGWPAFAAQVARSSAATVLFTDERLAAVGSDGIARVAELGAEREVHVVYLARGLDLLLPSAWQMEVRQGAVASLDEWLEATLAEDRAGPGVSWFWRVHDAPAVLARWSAAATSPRHVHVVTVPRSAEDPEELWRRFTAATDLPRGLPAPATVRSNPSLDYAQVEFLRRLNVELRGVLDPAVYRRRVRGVLSSRIMTQQASGRKSGLPQRYGEPVAVQASAIADALTVSGYDVVGELADLRADAAPSEAPEPPGVDAVLEAATAAMVGLLARERRDAASGDG